MRRQFLGLPVIERASAVAGGRGGVDEGARAEERIGRQIAGARGNSDGASEAIRVRFGGIGVEILGRGGRSRHGWVLEKLLGLCAKCGDYSPKKGTAEVQREHSVLDEGRRIFHLSFQASILVAWRNK